MDESGYETNRASEEYSQAEERREKDKSLYGKKGSERGNSLPGDRRRKNKSGHGRIAAERRSLRLTSWRSQRRDISVPQKNASQRRKLTSWRAEVEGQIRIPKQSERARDSHFLDSLKGRTNQDMEGKRVNEAHSLPKNAEGGVSQHTKINGASEAHSLPGERRGSDKSEHLNKASESRELTSLTA
jgi:hypothetical protein